MTRQDGGAPLGRYPNAGQEQRLAAWPARGAVLLVLLMGLAALLPSAGGDVITPPVGSLLQGRVDLEPAGPSWAGWDPPPSFVGPGEPLTAETRVVESGLLQVGPGSPRPATPPRYAKHVPVDTGNGELKLIETDLRVPSRGFPFAWVRVYSSRSRFDHGLGAGWDYPYNRRVSVVSSTTPRRILTATTGLGREDSYVETATGSNLFHAVGIFDEIILNADGSFTQVTPCGMMFQYDSAGFLVGQRDRAGNALTIARNSFHKIVSIRDVQDRLYTFTFTDNTSSQRIATITDFAGRTITYGYSPAGDLVRVTGPAVTGTPSGNDFPQGKTRLYVYTTGFSDGRLNHNLVRAIEPRQNVGDDPSRSKAWLTVQYYGTQNPANLNFDRVHRVRLGHNQGGPLSAPNVVVGGNHLFAYSTDLAGDTDAPAGSVLRSIERDANGNERVRYFDAGRYLVKLIERTNRGVRPGEGDYVTLYSYTSGDGLLATRTLPRGNGVGFLYDSANPLRRSQGNMIELREKTNGIAGGGPDLVTRYGYDPVFNVLRSITDPRAFPSGVVPLDASGHLDPGNSLVARYSTVNVIDYQEGSGFQASQGVPSSERIPEGLGDQNGAADFNEGNIVRVKFPTIQTAGPNAGDVIEESRTYNDRGQPLSVRDPESHVTSFSYFGTNGTPGDPGDREGYLRSVNRDDGGFNLRSEFDYDLVGNVVATRDPKGQQTDFVVNALNQVVRQLSRPPAGAIRYRTDYFYDLNDDLVRSEMTNQDENGIAYPHSLIVSDFEYNILHFQAAAVHDKTLNDGSGAGVIRTETMYDANLNATGTRTPLAVLGKQPRNVTTVLYDERDLVYQTIRGDDDTDPANAPPSPSSIRTTNYDANRSLLEEIDSVRDGINPAAPTTAFPGSGSGDVTRHVYDGHDRRVGVVDPEANTHAIAYDLATNPIRRTVSGPVSDATGSPVGTLRDREVVFDELLRPVRVVRKHFVSATGAAIGDGQSTTEFRYDRDSKIIEVTDDRGLRTFVAWDTADREFRLTDQLGNQVELARDANSNVTTITQREVSTDFGTPVDLFVTAIVYDGLDRRTRVVNPAGNVREYFFDSRDNVVKTSDGVRGTGHPVGPGNIVLHEFDALDRLVATTRRLTANGRGDTGTIATVTTRQRWDDNSRLVTVRDDNGHETRYVYDEIDRMTGINYADLTTRSATYDRDSKNVGLTDQNGTQVTIAYDGLHRPVSHLVARAVGVSGSAFENFGYDGASRLVRATNDDGLNLAPNTRSFDYDSLDNVIRDVQAGKPVDASYDGVSNRVQLTYPGDVASPGRLGLAFTFDGLNRLRDVLAGGVPIITKHYKGPRRLERRNYGSDAFPVATFDVSWDSRPRPVDVKHTFGPLSTTPGLVISHFQYGYDREDHRLFEKRVHDSNRGDVFAYDSIYRVRSHLKNVDLSGVAAGQEIQPESFASADSELFNYDGAGNRTTSVLTQAGAPTTTTYNQSPGNAEVNQYSSLVSTPGGTQVLTHDANGNLTSDGTLVFLYDFKNRLAEVRVQQTGAVLAQYAYDAFDCRTEKLLPGPGVRTRYFYDGERCIEERNGADQVTRQYIWGSGIVQERTPAAVFFLHENSMGSISALTTNGGTVAERYVYDAFGGTTVTLSGATGNEFRFHCMRQDQETGLYLVGGGSFYNPTLGQSLQRSGAGVGDTTANLGNGYASHGNDVVNYLTMSPSQGGIHSTTFVVAASARPASGLAGGILPTLVVIGAAGLFGSVEVGTEGRTQVGSSETGWPIPAWRPWTPQEAEDWEHQKALAIFYLFGTSTPDDLEGAGATTGVAQGPDPTPINRLTGLPLGEASSIAVGMTKHGLGEQLVGMAAGAAAGPVIRLCGAGIARVGSAVIGSSVVGAGATMGAAAVRIAARGIQHILQNHFAFGAGSVGRSIFTISLQELKHIIRLFASAPAVRSTINPNNWVRVVRLDRPVGIDRATGKLTDVVTIVSNAAGDLVTAHPGFP